MRFSITGLPESRKEVGWWLPFSSRHSYLQATVTGGEHREDGSCIEDVWRRERDSACMDVCAYLCPAGKEARPDNIRLTHTRDGL